MSFLICACQEHNAISRVMLLCCYHIRGHKKDGREFEKYCEKKGEIWLKMYRKY